MRQFVMCELQLLEWESQSEEQTGVSEGSTLDHFIQMYSLKYSSQANIL